MGSQQTTFHWAWAELNVTSDYDVEVVAFGYETEPDTPIQAGVPEPNSLASLALGAAALLPARRRKRTA